MDEGALLMGHICSKIFTADDIPAISELIFYFPLDDAGYFAVLLRLEYALDISNFLNSRVRNANNDAFLFRGHIRVSDEDFFARSVSVLLIIDLNLLLVSSDVGHQLYNLTLQSIESKLIQQTNNIRCWMENIQIKRQKNKRNIQSLLQDSAIDHSYNFQAQELKRAFNQTVVAMNIKNNQLEKQVERLKIVVRQDQEHLNLYQNKIGQIQKQLVTKNNQLAQLAHQYREVKKKLQYFEYKFECINQNRNFLEQEDSNIQFPTERDAEKKKKVKNQIYLQFSRMILKKVEYFTTDMKRIIVSKQAEQRIEAFLEELVYINPHSQFKVKEEVKEQRRGYLKGKIVNERQNANNDQDQWRMLQKSLEKLKVINTKHRGPLPPSSQSEQVPIERSTSPKKRKRLFY